MYVFIVCCWFCILVFELVELFGDCICVGWLQVGDKLFIEVVIVGEFDVSCIVVCEVIFKLQVVGLVEICYGIGIFVLGFGDGLLFKIMLEQFSMLQDVIVVLELCIGLEIEVVGLVVLCCSDVNFVVLCKVLDVVIVVVEVGQDLVVVDFQFYFEIVCVMQNSYFVDLMVMFGVQIILWVCLELVVDMGVECLVYMCCVNVEYESIFDVIVSQDVELVCVVMCIYFFNSCECCCKVQVQVMEVGW